MATIKYIPATSLNAKDIVPYNNVFPSGGGSKGALVGTSAAWGSINPQIINYKIVTDTTPTYAASSAVQYVGPVQADINTWKSNATVYKCDPNTAGGNGATFHVYGYDQVTKDVPNPGNASEYTVIVRSSQVAASTASMPGRTTITITLGQTNIHAVSRYSSMTLFIKPVKGLLMYTINGEYADILSQDKYSAVTVNALDALSVHPVDAGSISNSISAEDTTITFGTVTFELLHNEVGEGEISLGIMAHIISKNGSDPEPDQENYCSVFTPTKNIEFKNLAMYSDFMFTDSTSGAGGNEIDDVIAGDTVCLKLKDKQPGYTYKYSIKTNYLELEPLTEIQSDRDYAFIETTPSWFLYTNTPPNSSVTTPLIVSVQSLLGTTVVRTVTHTLRLVMTSANSGPTIGTISVSGSGTRYWYDTDTDTVKTYSNCFITTKDNVTIGGTITTKYGAALKSISYSVSTSKEVLVSKTINFSGSVSTYNTSQVLSLANMTFACNTDNIASDLNITIVATDLRGFTTTATKTGYKAIKYMKPAVRFLNCVRSASGSGYDTLTIKTRCIRHVESGSTRHKFIVTTLIKKSTDSAYTNVWLKYKTANNQQTAEIATTATVTAKASYIVESGPSGSYDYSSVSTGTPDTMFMYHLDPEAYYDIMITVDDGYETNTKSISAVPSKVFIQIKDKQAIGILTPADTAYPLSVGGPIKSRGISFTNPDGYRQYSFAPFATSNPTYEDIGLYDIFNEQWIFKRDTDNERLAMTSPQGANLFFKDHNNKFRVAALYASAANSYYASASNSNNTRVALGESDRPWSDLVFNLKSEGYNLDYRRFVYNPGNSAHLGGVKLQDSDSSVTYLDDTCTFAMVLNTGKDIHIYMPGLFINGTATVRTLRVGLYAPGNAQYPRMSTATPTTSANNSLGTLGSIYGYSATATDAENAMGRPITNGTLLTGGCVTGVTMKGTTFGSVIIIKHAYRLGTKTQYMNSAGTKTYLLDNHMVYVADIGELEFSIT